MSILFSSIKESVRWLESPIYIYFYTHRIHFYTHRLYDRDGLFSSDQKIFVLGDK